MSSGLSGPQSLSARSRPAGGSATSSAAGLRAAKARCTCSGRLSRKLPVPVMTIPRKAGARMAAISSMRLPAAAANSRTPASPKSSRKLLRSRATERGVWAPSSTTGGERCRSSIRAGRLAAARPAAIAPSGTPRRRRPTKARAAFSPWWAPSRAVRSSRTPPSSRRRCTRVPSGVDTTSRTCGSAELGPIPDSGRSPACRDLPASRGPMPTNTIEQPRSRAAARSTASASGT